MTSRVSGALLGVGITLAIFAATVLPAAAATSGSETVQGLLVTSGVSGTRTDISSVAVARGVFDGVGRIVEIPAQPGDPPNVSRDDLVYPEGTMHLVNTTVGASFTVNPHNCLFRATTRQDSGWPGSSSPLSMAARRSSGFLPGARARRRQTFSALLSQASTLGACGRM